MAPTRSTYRLARNFCRSARHRSFTRCCRRSLSARVLYFELPSFNTVGGGAQTLSETTIYSYVPVGSSVIPGTFPVVVVKDHLAPSEIASGTTRRDSQLPIEDERHVVVTDQHQPIEQRRLVQQDGDDPLESS